MEADDVYELPSLSSPEHDKHVYQSMSPQRFNDTTQKAQQNAAKPRKSITMSTPFAVLTVLLCLILMLLVAILCLLLFQMFVREKSDLCTSTETNNSSTSNPEWAQGLSQNMLKLLNSTKNNDKIFQATRDSAQMLMNIANLLSNLQNMSTTTAGVADDVLMAVEKLVLQNNESSAETNDRSNSYPEWAQGLSQNVLILINSTKIDEKIFQATWDSAQMLMNIANLLSSLQNISTTTAGVTDNVLMAVEKLVLLNNKSSAETNNSSTSYPEWAQGLSQNVLTLLNSTNNDEKILQATRDSAQMLMNVLNLLSSEQNISTTTAGVTDDILMAVGKLLLLNNESLPISAMQCKDIKKREPFSTSGEYLLLNRYNYDLYYSYCNMEELCGSGGGWTRLAYLNMSDATQNCPSGFTLYQTGGGIRACGRRRSSGGSCVSVQFPSNNISYSQVCGRVVGYQHGSTDSYNSGNLNSYYIDGVSITRGSPRQHVWSLITGYTEINTRGYSCPCNNGSKVGLPAFIGSDYFCESGNKSPGTRGILYTSDQLWDGQDCTSLEATCCDVPGLPWFHRDYGNATTSDYLELRVCGSAIDEDSPVSFYEIYVK